MAVGISNFPTSLDAASDLVEATNNAFTTINMVGGLSSGATTITVVSTASFPDTGIVRINNEIISYSAKTATTFTVQTRGFESTTAASHANGDQVSLDITASSNNAKNSAIIALETKVGTGSSTPTANTVLRGTGTGTSGFGQVALTTDVTGTLPVANGGTGVTTSTGTGSVVLSNNPTMVSATIGQATYTTLTHSTTGGVRIGWSSPDVIDTGGGGIAINPGSSSPTVAIGGQIIAEVPDHSTFGVPARIELGYKAPTAGRDRLLITTTGTGSNSPARTMTVQPAANLAANCTVTIPDGTDTLVTRNGTATLTNKTIDVLSNTITGTFSPSNGGTGLNSIPANNVILGNGVFTVQTVAPGTSGNVLTSNGTTWTSASPAASGGGSYKNVLVNGDMRISQRNTNGLYPSFIGAISSVNTGQDLLTLASAHGLRIQITRQASNLVADVERVRLFGTTAPGGTTFRTRYVPQIGATGSINASSSTFTFSDIELNANPTRPATTPSQGQSTGWVAGQNVKIWGAGANYWQHLTTTVSAFTDNSAPTADTLTLNANASTTATHTLIERTHSLQLLTATTSGAPGGSLIDITSAGTNVNLYRDTFVKYTLDCWYTFAGSQGAGGGDAVIDVARDTDAPTGFVNSIKLTVPTGWPNEKFFLAQIIEQANCAHLVGQQVTLSFRARVSNARIGNVRAAILAWTGTADTFTDDAKRIVSTTNGYGTDGGGLGTLATDWNIVASSANLNVGTSFGSTVYTVSGTVAATYNSKSVTNLAVLIWNDDLTTNAGDSLWVTGVQLEQGASATSYEVMPASVQLERARYYFEVCGTFTLVESGVMFITLPVFWLSAKRTTPLLTCFDDDGCAGKVTMYPNNGTPARTGIGYSVLRDALSQTAWLSSALLPTNTAFRFTLDTDSTAYYRAANSPAINYGGMGVLLWADANL